MPPGCLAVVATGALDFSCSESQSVIVLITSGLRYELVTSKCPNFGNVAIDFFLEPSLLNKLLVDSGWIMWSSSP